MKLYSLGLYEKAMPAHLSWRERLLAVRTCGFDYLEISIDETDEKQERLCWSKKQRAELRQISYDCQAPIQTMCLSGHRKYSLGSRDDVMSNRGMDMLSKAIEFASDLGIRVIQLAGYDVYYEQGDLLTREKFYRNLSEGVKMAAQAGVMLGFETMENSFMDTVAKAMVYVSAIRSPYLGVYPDIGNLQNASVRYGTDILAELSVGTGHTLAAHLKETQPDVYRNMRFGEGHTSYESCIHLLYDMGVRMFTAEFWYQGEEDYCTTIEQAASFLRCKIHRAIHSVWPLDS